jgi:hypothetical protein
LRRGGEVPASPPRLPARLRSRCAKVSRPTRLSRSDACPRLPPPSWGRVPRGGPGRCPALSGACPRACAEVSLRWRVVCPVGGVCWGSVVWRTSRSVPPLPSPSRRRRRRRCCRRRRREGLSARSRPVSPAVGADGGVPAPAWARVARRAPRAGRRDGGCPSTGGRGPYACGVLSSEAAEAVVLPGVRTSAESRVGVPVDGAGGRGCSLLAGGGDSSRGGCSSDSAGLRLPGVAGDGGTAPVGGRWDPAWFPRRPRAVRSAGLSPSASPSGVGLPSALAVADPRRAPGRPVAVRRSVACAGVEPRPARRGRGLGLDEASPWVRRRRRVRVGPSRVGARARDRRCAAGALAVRFPCVGPGPGGRPGSPRRSFPRRPRG